MTNLLTAHLGEAAALIVALTWASAVILFKKSGESVHPLALNLFKNVLAFVLLIPTIFFLGKSYPSDLSNSDIWMLIISGALGIGLSDSMFFRSLNLLGAGLSAIVDCLYSPFIIGLSILFLGESLNALQVVGTVMIISAVLTAVRIKGSPNLKRKDLIWGVFWGVMAMATMAVGIVMIKPILDKTALLWVTQIRLIGGILVLLVILGFTPKRWEYLATLKFDKGKIYTWTGSFIGAYLAMILWITGMKFTQASTAAALNQTSNIFVFILAALFLKERITWQRGIGIILGVTGAVMVIVFRATG